MPHLYRLEENEMKAVKHYKNHPECFLIVPKLDEDNKPVEGEDVKLEGYFLGTVREAASQGSFLTAIDLGLMFELESHRLLKVPLDKVQFKK